MAGDHTSPPATLPKQPNNSYTTQCYLSLSVGVGHQINIWRYHDIIDLAIFSTTKENLDMQRSKLVINSTENYDY